MNNEQALIHYKSKANGIISVGQQRGYDVPTEYSAATAMAVEAARMSREPAPILGTPKDLKDVSATITKTARARLEYREMQAVAGEVEANCTRVAITSALAIAPTYAGKICTEYDELLTTFSNLISTAPHEISGTTSPEEFLQHAELLRAQEGLALAYAHRGLLASHIDADEGAVGANAIWLIIDPTPNAALSEVRSVLIDFAQTIPSTIEDWSRIVRLGSSMATPGGASARLARFAEATQSAASTADGGVLDRTYAEALALHQR